MKTTVMKPPSHWIPETDEVTLAVIGKLGEELCENGAAIFRCVIQGIGEKHPETGKPNLDWLSEEIADVEAMIELAKRKLNLPRKEISDRATVKFNHKSEWIEGLEARKRDRNVTRA